MLKEKLRGLSLRLAKLEARLVLSERKASEGRKVTARILAHKAEGVISQTRKGQNEFMTVILLNHWNDAIVGISNSRTANLCHLDVHRSFLLTFLDTSNSFHR